MISYPYPTLQQAEEAGIDLVPQLIGQQPRNVPAMVQDCYALIGFGLSRGLPIPAPKLGDAPDSAEPQLADALRPLCIKEGAASLAVDWKVVLKLALQFLLQALGCILLLLALGTSTRADEHRARAQAAVAVAAAQIRLNNDCEPPCNDATCKCTSKGDCLCGSACFCQNCEGKKSRTDWQEWHNGWWRNSVTSSWWHPHFGPCQTPYVQPWSGCQPGFPAIGPISVGPSCRQ